MGIKNLNRFLIDRCQTSSIQKINLSDLQNKTIVVDTSIYLYRYLGQNAIIENFYQMISIFRKYNIAPLFIFDGKPPVEKHEIIQHRKCTKDAAEQKYNKLKETLKTANNKTDTLLTMECLKKQFLRIHDKDIECVKRLIHHYGAMYYVADGEADCICAQLVIQGKAWACLSDDMDMLVYGCPRVLRHFSLLNHTVLQYNLYDILTDLDIPLNMFRQIMVLYGTDYLQTDTFELDKMINYYENYKNTTQKISPVGFYQWITQNTPHLIKYEEVLRIYRLFCESDTQNNAIKTLDIVLTNFDKQQLYEFIADDGFIVVE
jgi:5'-3' exonuclease